MEVSKERLCIIGKLIRIHREERKRESKSSRWTQSEFCKNICAPGTLTNIEKGCISRFIEYYPDLLANLDLEFGEFPKVDAAINILINQLYTALEYSRKEDVIKITAKGKNLLEKINNVVYYSDIYTIFKTLNRYIDQEIFFGDKFMYLSIELYSILPKKLVDVLKSLTFSNAYMYSNDKDFLCITKKLELEDSDYVGNKYNLLIYYAVNDKSVKFLNLCAELEALLIKTNNITRLFELYSMSIPLMNYIDKSMIPYYMDKIDNLIEQKVIPNSKIADYYYHTGISEYNEANYANAIDSFQKSLLYDKCLELPSSLLIASCQQRLGMSIEIVDINQKVLDDNPELLRAIYSYYKLPKDTPLFIKQENIMENILPLLENNEPLFTDMMKYELEELIKETNQYKDEHIYSMKYRTLFETD